MSSQKTSFPVLLTNLAVLLTALIPDLSWSLSTGVAGSSPALSSRRFSDEITISGSGENRLPALAYNSREGEYLIVWQYKLSDTFRQIVAIRLSKSGLLLGTPSALNSGMNCFQPAVAYNYTNNEYLVVWARDPDGSTTKNEIWGRICQLRPDYGGCVQGDFLIAKWDNRSFWSPRVVWNSTRNEYLVIWNATDSSTVPTDVAGYRLTAAGSVINPGSPIIIFDLNQPHQADVAYNPVVDEYLVVWRHLFSAGDGDIYARRLSGDGSFPGDAFAVHAPTSDQRFPAVATNQTDRYLVVWQHGSSIPSFNWDIYALEVGNGGNLLGSVAALGDTADNEMAPRVAARTIPGRDFVVTWEQATTAGVRIQADHWTETHQALDVASFIFWDNEKPVAAVGTPGCLFVYEGQPTGDPASPRQIYGRLYWPSVINLPLILRQ